MPTNMPNVNTPGPDEDGGSAAVDTSTPPVQRPDVQRPSGQRPSGQAAPVNNTTPVVTPVPQGNQNAPTPAVDQNTGGGQPPAQSAQPAQAQPATAQAKPTQPAQGAQTQSSGQPQPVAESGDQQGTRDRPMIDPRPYAWLAENDPIKRGMVDNAAQQAGITPARLAAHWYQENRFRLEDAPNSNQGAVGPMQVLPSTGPSVSNGGRLDINKPTDNLVMGANYIRQMDDQFGKDSYASVLAYHGGPGSVADIAAHPDQAADRHPKSIDYANKIIYGSNPAAIAAGTQNATPSNITAPGIMQASNQGGPDGALKYIIQAKGGDMSMSDGWAAAESALVKSQLNKGNIEGAQHARDFILQLSHTGSNQWLMQAAQSLQTGDGQGAAQALARAHAFFPDGTTGQFGIDGKGNVWGQRVNENSGEVVGSPFKVDANGVAGLLNQTRDPQQFAKGIYAEQAAAADAHLKATHAQYYQDLLPSRERIDAANNTRAIDVANIGAGSREAVAATRPGANGATKPPAGLDKEITNAYGDGAVGMEAYSGDEHASDRAKMAQMHQDMRTNGGANPVTAEYASKGLTSGKLMVQKQSDGSYGVVDPKNPNHVISYLSGNMVASLHGGEGPKEGSKRTSDVGSRTSQMNGPPTMAGTGSPAGTPQSSAVPAGAVNTQSGPPTNQQMSEMQGTMQANAM